MLRDELLENPVPKYDYEQSQIRIFSEGLGTINDATKSKLERQDRRVIAKVKDDDRREDARQEAPGMLWDNADSVSDSGEETEE